MISRKQIFLKSFTLRIISGVIINIFNQKKEREREREKIRLRIEIMTYLNQIKVPFTFLY